MVGPRSAQLWVVNMALTGKQLALNAKRQSPLEAYHLTQLVKISSQFAQLAVIGCCSLIDKSAT